eukprot:TRINITY_DN45374_c0_g1_i1.p1 TRINITY_DN45374_c0_g1~~TRINITY_DN45374_c0_g1_i1.p1  ORF type:complete len:352 (-),score=75.95 TRINITY_DN45374_c0_g1_i1:9-1001(-)
MFFSTLCVALLSFTSAVIVGKRSEGEPEEAAIDHRLRVCNAYPSSHALKVLKNNIEFMGQSQMKYKECTELKGPFKEHDQLNFETDGVPLSTFTVTDVPQEKSTLLLVAYREDNSSTRILFKSHVFTPSKLAQVAVIDTFQGQTVPDLLISQIKPDDNTTGAFQGPLELNSVMDLAAGVYQVEITTVASDVLAGPFIVEGGEDYVFLRTGLDDTEYSAPSFLQEMQEAGSPTTGDDSFKGAATLTHAADSTGGPDVPDSSKDSSATKGKSSEQFLGLARLERYPEEFVVYPLVKPQPANAAAEEEPERSGATPAGFAAASAAAFLVAAML